MPACAAGEHKDDPIYPSPAKRTGWHGSFSFKSAGTKLRRDAESEKSYLHGEEIKTAEQNLGEIHLTAKGKIMTQNEKAMQYLMNQVKMFSKNPSSFTNGVIWGACQGLCMAGIITAKQWEEIEELQKTKKTS